MKRIDLILLISVVFLTLFGLFMIYDVSSFVAFRDFSDKYHYIKGQFFWVIAGFGLMGLFSLFNYQKLYNLSLPIILSAIVLLILVFVPGIGVKLLGARRWIDAKVFLIQPAEFVKLALAIYLASWLSSKEKGRFMAFLLLLGLVLGLVILEPDMGTAVVILSEALVVYFLSGGNIIYFMVMVPVAAAVGFILIKLSPYRLKRLETFFDINQSIQDSSYHVRQVLIAFGSGGIFGVGLGNSLQKYSYLPEITTDSIFAIIGEEFGFIGATIVMILFFVLVLSALRIAFTASDDFGKLLAGGIAFALSLQIIINLSAMVSLIPLTGIPLPFISYGGSNLVVSCAMIGILASIARLRKSTK